MMPVHHVHRILKQVMLHVLFLCVHPAVLFIAYTTQPDETILQAIQSENLDNGDYAVLLYAPLSGYDFAFADTSTTNQYLDALKTVIIFSDDTPQQLDTESYNEFLQRVADTSAQPPINIAGTTVS